MEPRNQYAKTKDGVNIAFWTMGETELRGFEDPVRLFELRWREEA